MYCKYCGAHIDDSSKFCSKCGAKIEIDDIFSTPKNTTIIEDKPKRNTNDGFKQFYDIAGPISFVMSLVLLAIFIFVPVFRHLSIPIYLLGIIMAVLGMFGKRKAFSIIALIIFAVILVFSILMLFSFFSILFIPFFRTI